MRKLFALLLFVLNLNACDLDPSKTTRVSAIRELSLPKGRMHELRDLPKGFQYCLTHGAKPVAPACRFAKA
ncbi:hypothetical protein [Arenimonas oryziterrae]|uniref:Lipoprotein n=1 Tax=Arenimonas oryziterrae DSM 21050 = YC6267 TaxID=1121015 RepID=A0A091APW7_9GAMM|nr:hypothetical protein [Arenimonas oryziterrae]KFN41019.1 hypothetical protein N789_03815 [Arenimonas oryziterrae DSM 21050 = YC6267]